MSILIACAAKATQIRGERLMIWIGSIWLDGGDNGLRGHKARDVVNVAVGIVAGDAAVQPDHVYDAEIIVERSFDLLARKPGVALLHFAQQAFLGRQQNAFAIRIDRSALENQATL